MDLDPALAWASQRTDGILITIRRDGRPQSSDITYAYVDGIFAISLTDGRAKTANMRRDDRVVLHITDRESYSYLSFDGIVELLAPASEPDDPTTNALVGYYERVAGAPHPDWDEYRAAMVAERRLLAYFSPRTVVGQIN